jgi:hypothetical protein
MVNIKSTPTADIERNDPSVFRASAPLNVIPYDTRTSLRYAPRADPGLTAREQTTDCREKLRSDARANAEHQDTADDAQAEKARDGGAQISSRKRNRRVEIEWNWGRHCDTPPFVSGDSNLLG